MKSHLAFPGKLVILASLFLAGCAQAVYQSNTPEPSPSASVTPPIKASPVQTDTALPTKAPPPPLQITPTPYQGGQILDLTYTDRLWALVGEYEYQFDQTALTDLILESSRDGGANWEKHSIPAAVPAGQSDNFLAGRVTFLDQNTGWVYDPGLFETQDSGRSWKTIQTGEEIDAIAPAPDSGGQTWALEAACPATVGNCSYRLLSLDPQTGILKPLPGYDLLSAGQDAALMRAGEHTAYVLAAYFPGQDQYPFFAMWVTDGSGFGWKKLNIPTCEVAVASLSPDGTFWLLCGSGPGAGNQAKAIFMSSDQGKSWYLRSLAGPGPWESTPTPPAAKPIQTEGYIDSMLALSKEEALIGLSRDTLQLSVDGGLDWEEAIPLTASTPVEFFGWKMVCKPGSDEVWAEATTWPISSWLFHSTDRGRSWATMKINWP